MSVFHAAIRCADDYVSRREPHRRAHIDRLQGLRGAGIVVGGGPAPDGKTADIFYGLQRPDQLKAVIEEDPYWRAGAWIGYAGRRFTEFIEPSELPPVVLDGSRRATLVEGPTLDAEAAVLALVDLRGTRRLAFGGLLETGGVLTLLATADAAEAVRWLADTGFWVASALTARPFLYVL